MYFIEVLSCATTLGVAGEVVPTQTRLPPEHCVTPAEQTPGSPVEQATPPPGFPSSI
jgi:hypothetical protein